jgi:dihydrofolate reductase/thymidylate synthase
MARAFSLVVAATRGRGIGRDGAVPWRLPEDLKFFRRVTSAHDEPPHKRNAVIMGRKTWDSIPERFRPLAERLNVVITSRKAELAAALAPLSDVRVVGSLPEALQLVSPGGAEAERVARVLVIGGGQVYRDALALPQCESIYYTLVDADVPCDTFFPELDPRVFALASESPWFRDAELPYQFRFFRRVASAPAPASPGAPVAAASAGGEAKGDAGAQGNAEEQQYLDLVRDIIDRGVLRGDRTGTGTLAKFGCQMRFSLREGRFPLLTTKRVFWRGVAEELLWFISGDTNARTLNDKGIKIWEANGSRAFLDSLGLREREEGDLGPVYGFQWRHFGAKYTNMHADYRGQGVDQLAAAIHAIKTNPNDRRIVISAWNPADLKLMALPPCHMFAQFFVANGELSCQMYQRSCDMGLGVPFNIASYALLTRLVAQVCGLQPGEFVHTLGDAHVYLNHVEALREQLKRTPRPFPVLRIRPEVRDIDAFRFDDFELVGYDPHDKLAMKMAV